MISCAVALLHTDRRRFAYGRGAWPTSSIRPVVTAARSAAGGTTGGDSLDGTSCGPICTGAWRRWLPVTTPAWSCLDNVLRVRQQGYGLPVETIRIWSFYRVIFPPHPPPHYGLQRAVSLLGGRARRFLRNLLEYLFVMWDTEYIFDGHGVDQEARP